MHDAFELTEEYARSLDRQDELARYRSQFYSPDGIVYLDGNSLGLLCRPAERSLLETLEQWKTQAIGGWLDARPAWFELAEYLGTQLAPLVGAGTDEVIVANSTTVNLHQLLATFYDPRAQADVILADSLCFPSDRYALCSFLRLVGKEADRKLRLVESHDGLFLDEEVIISHMKSDVQMVVLPSVLYTSGQLLDVRRLTRAAHERAILIGFDCSHSVGVVPHEFDRDDVDFAFFCTYKYLNGGPGSLAAIYLNRRHIGKPAGLAGWFGSKKERQFEMSDEFYQAEHAGALQIGTPPILAVAPLRGALDLVNAAGIERIRGKSLKLTAFLRQLIVARLSRFGLRCIEPEEESRRGGHVAVVHPQARSISLALRAHGVIPDFRPPNIVRLAPAPLYTSFADCRHAVDVFYRVMDTRAFEANHGGDEFVT